MPHNSLDTLQLDQLGEALAFLEEADRTTLQSAITGRQLRQGENLFAAGDLSDGLYFLLEGRLAVKKQTGFGRTTQVIALLSPFAPVGEAVCAGVATREATVQAVQDSALLFLPRAAFELLRDEQPKLAGALMSHLLRSACLRLEKSSARLAHIL